LDGAVVVQVQDRDRKSFAIQTPVALSGPATIHTFDIRSGRVDTLSVEQNLATSAVGNERNVRLSGDTDRNGSLDLVFPTSWVDLFATLPRP
jgi:hypothetical protein